MLSVTYGLKLFLNRGSQVARKGTPVNSNWNAFQRNIKIVIKTLNCFDLCKNYRISDIKRAESLIQKVMSLSTIEWCSLKIVALLPKSFKRTCQKVCFQRSYWPKVCTFTKKFISSQVFLKDFAYFLKWLLLLHTNSKSQNQQNER